MANPISNLWFSQAYYDPVNPTPIYLQWQIDGSTLYNTVYHLQLSKSDDGLTWGPWHWENEASQDYLRLNNCLTGLVVCSKQPETEGSFIRCRIGVWVDVYDPVEDVTSTQMVYAITGNSLRRLSNTLASDWELESTSVDAGDSVTVNITQTYQADYVTPGLAYTHKVTATFGALSASVDMAEYETSTSLTLPLDFLREMPDAVSSPGTITVKTYREGSPVGSASQAFTLTCPETIVPSITTSISRMLTVDGVTYPDVTGGYVQNKSAVQVDISSSEGAYGSRIVGYSINVAGRYSDGYNSDTPSLSSALLVDVGDVPVTCTVTDSRGRTTAETANIYVEPYSPPQADFKAWRVNESGNADTQGKYGRYEYSYTYTDFGGVNTCTASLTVAGQTARNVPESGDVLPNNKMEFPTSSTYSVVLTLTDAYGSTLFASVLPAYTGTTVIIRPSKYEKRRMIFGEYDTALDGLWTLTGWTLPEPEYQSNFVQIPGRHGLLDLSTVLSDGEPIYGNRLLTATFECSEGTRLERNERISQMVNSLDGHRMSIVLPDDPTRCVEGRVSVRTEYSDPAHAAVTVTADCDPWRYNIDDTIRAFDLTSQSQQAFLVNKGRRIAVPTVTVLGEKAIIRCRDDAWELYDGVYVLPDLALRTGKTMLTYSGMGTLIISYREAVL